MTIEIDQTICNGYLMKSLVAAGLAWLEHNRERVNQMNVFPVPDGDTGTNMVLTMQKGYESIAHIDEPSIGVVSKQLARGTLRGARGNSGVILSQLLAGFATVLDGSDEMDVHLFVQACQRGAEIAYQAVQEPVEGTILTVAREAAETLRDDAGDDLMSAFETLLTAARASLARTPDLLPELKRAGVRDSGGQGLVFILEGMHRAINGLPVHLSENHHSVTATTVLPASDDAYGYDVQFLMYDVRQPVPQIRADIEAIGWSALVVGDNEMVKVHVHVHDPGVPISYAIQNSAHIDDVVVENMQVQYEQRMVAHPVETSIAVIAVAPGEGMRAIFQQELGAVRVITGGQTMNPSTDDFLNAIRVTGGQKIILLPNNKNVVMAAQQAASMVPDREIEVVKTTSIPQGIAAMLAYLNAGVDDPVKVVAAAMADSAAQVITGEVTQATRNAHFDRVDIHQDDFIGILNGELVTASEDCETVIQDLLNRAGASYAELVTLYYGSDISETQAQAMVDTLQPVFPDQEFHIVYGGQPLYPFIVGVE